MKTIGKYEILGLMGKGGMGRVYKVRLPVAGRIVALKRLEPEETFEMLVGREKMEELFRREVAMLGSLAHRNIVGVLDVDRDDQGRPFYTMEFYCNNLGAMMGERYIVEEPTRPLPVGMAVDCCLQTLAGLERLHEGGILHRDVKPFNLMLTDDGVVKLIDFGLSRLRGETDAHPGQVKIGTPYYTAPEQEADADVADERSDLFSVGVMLYRMLTGELPAERRDDYRRPSVHDELLDADWDEFLHTARHPEPERRFQSAETMAKELHAVHADWSARIAQACRIEEPTPTVNQAPPPRVEPVKVGPDASLSVLPVDALWRPKRYIAGVEEAGPELARQPATGLVWQRGGSPYPLDWSAAAEYVRTLNRENYKGFSDWRLPTADELLAAMLPPTELSSYCLESVFAADRRLLWSADTRSFAAAWYADAALGFVWWADMGCRFHARAVRSERGERR